MISSFSLFRFRSPLVWLLCIAILPSINGQHVPHGEQIDPSVQLPSSTEELVAIAERIRQPDLLSPEQLNEVHNAIMLLERQNHPGAHELHRDYHQRDRTHQMANWYNRERTGAWQGKRTSEIAPTVSSDPNDPGPFLFEFGAGSVSVESTITLPTITRVPETNEFPVTLNESIKWQGDLLESDPANPQTPASRVGNVTILLQFTPEGKLLLSGSLAPQNPAAELAHFPRRAEDQPERVEAPDPLAIEPTVIAHYKLLYNLQRGVLIIDLLDADGKRLHREFIRDISVAQLAAWPSLSPILVAMLPPDTESEEAASTADLLEGLIRRSIRRHVSTLAPELRERTH